MKRPRFKNTVAMRQHMRVLDETIVLVTRQKHDMEEKLESTSKSYNEEYRRRLTAESDAKEARGHFADLKQQLLAAQTEVARLNGYMERVREDDNVADPLVEIEDQDGRRSVSKRHPTRPYLRDHNGSIHDMLERANGREKSKHWTSY